MRLLSLSLCAAVLGILLTACAPGDAPADAPTGVPVVACGYCTPGATPRLTAAPIPAPSGAVLLTVFGSIGAGNISPDTFAAMPDPRAIAGPSLPTATPLAGGIVAFDLATLEALGVVEYRVLDAQGVGREAVFRGVLLDTLLTVVQAAQDATTLHLVALDGYEVDIPISDARQYPVLLATQMDGVPLDIATYGPVRVIYPYGYATFDASVVDARWVFSVMRIEVR